MNYYYSLKTKKEEHALEKRIGGDYDYAVYDLKQNLLKPKKLIKKDNVVEFLWEKQKELKQVFEKVELEQESKVEKDVDELLRDAIKKGLAEGFAEKYDVVESYETGDTEVRTRKVLLQGNKRSPLMTKDTDYVLVAKIDLDTEAVELAIHSSVSKTDEEAAETQKKLVTKLFASLAVSFPDIVENHLCSAVAAQTGKSYGECVDSYREQQSLRVKVYQQIVDMLIRSLDVYKKQLLESYAKK